MGEKKLWELKFYKDELEIYKIHYNYLIDFIKKVSNQDMGYHPLAVEAEEILKKIGEISG